MENVQLKKLLIDAVSGIQVTRYLSKTDIVQIQRVRAIATHETDDVIAHFYTHLTTYFGKNFSTIVIAKSKAPTGCLIIKVFNLKTT